MHGLSQPALSHAERTAFEVKISAASAWRISGEGLWGNCIFQVIELCGGRSLIHPSNFKIAFEARVSDNDPYYSEIEVDKCLEIPALL